MSYPHVLICEANESDRKVFSVTLSDCYIDQCEHLEELNDLLKQGEYDAIFLGRSSVIEFLDGETAIFEKISDSLISEGLYMFRVGDDLKIQVKRMSIYSPHSTL